MRPQRSRRSHRKTPGKAAYGTGMSCHTRDETMNDRMKLGALLGALAVSACSSGGIEGGQALGPDGPAGSGGAPGSASGADTRLVRLSHLQYESTLGDLFGVDDGVQ